MTTDYECLVPNTSSICMYKIIRVWRLWAPRWPWARPMCLAHSAHPIATPLVFGSHQRHLPPSIWQIAVFRLLCATPDNEAERRIYVGSVQTPVKY